MEKYTMFMDRKNQYSENEYTTQSKHYPQWWKIESISPKVRNKTRVPTFTATIQHSSGSFDHSNQSRKRNTLVVQMVRNLPAMRETWVWPLDWEDHLEEGMATHFSTLAWRIPWTEEPGGLQSTGSQRVRHDWLTKHSMATTKPAHDVISWTGPLPIIYWETAKGKAVFWGPECTF